MIATLAQLTCENLELGKRSTLLFEKSKSWCLTCLYNIHMWFMLSTYLFLWGSWIFVMVYILGRKYMSYHSPSENSRYKSLNCSGKYLCCQNSNTNKITGKLDPRSFFLVWVRSLFHFMIWVLPANHPCWRMV